MKLWNPNPCKALCGGYFQWTKWPELPKISSQSRYDHFDIAPCLFPPAILAVSKALKNPLERKAGEKAKKYSIWIFGNPELARVFEGTKITGPAEISSRSRCDHFDTSPCSIGTASFYHILRLIATVSVKIPYGLCRTTIHIGQLKKKLWGIWSHGL